MWSYAAHHFGNVTPCVVGARPAVLAASSQAPSERARQAARPTLKAFHLRRKKTVVFLVSKNPEFIGGIVTNKTVEDIFYARFYILIPSWVVGINTVFS